jgi:Flp pilus assembly protein TadB
MQKYRRWHDRRRHKGRFMPITYLALEAILLLLIVYIVAMSKIVLLVIVAVVFAIHHFLTSCLPRYHRAIRRQKYIEDRFIY